MHGYPHNVCTDPAELDCIDRALFSGLDRTPMHVLDLTDWLQVYGAAHLSAIERIELAERITRRLFLVGAGALVLAGCGAPEQAASPTATSANDGYPRIVEHEGGQLTVERRPGRVVALSPYSELDVLLALGAEPVARGEIGDELRPWQVDAGAESIPILPRTSETNIEALVALRPDLIVLNGVEYVNYPEMVEQVVRVAPVLALSPDNLELQLRTTAFALGIADDIRDNALARITKAFEGFRAPRTVESIVAVEYFGGATLGLWTATSPGSTLMRRLGLPNFTTPDGVANDQTTIFAEISFEEIDALEADLLLVSGTDLNRAAIDELVSNPLFLALDVVREKRWYRLNTAEVFAVHDVTVLSAPFAVETVERALRETSV